MPTSEGEEGKFYVWTQGRDRRGAGRGRRQGLRRGLRRDRRRQLGRPHHPQPPAQSRRCARPPRRRRWPHMRAKLLARRASRIRPGWDDKVLADWNGLMIAALAHAARVFDRPDWLEAADDRLRVRRRAHGDGRPPDPLLSRRPGQGAGHRQRLRQHDLGRAAALPGHQRRRPTSPPPSAGAPRSTRTTGSPTPAATPSPPTTRPT